LRFVNSAVKLFEFPVYRSQAYDTIIAIPYPKAVRYLSCMAADCAKLMKRVAQSAQCEWLCQSAESGGAVRTAYPARTHARARADIDTNGLQGFSNPQTALFCHDKTANATRQLDLGVAGEAPPFRP
jgi:hypothetical protein